MAQFRRPEELLCCSFCGKSQNDVRKLIAGPGVYVCNECIDICNEIINDDEQNETTTSRTAIPKPQEINNFLDEYVIGQEESKKRLSVRFINITNGSSWQSAVRILSFKNRTFC